MHAIHMWISQICILHLLLVSIHSIKLLVSLIFSGWCDAAYKCTKPCPNGGVNVVDGVEEPECPDGETCFVSRSKYIDRFLASLIHSRYFSLQADIPCDSNAAPVPVPAIPPPPTSSPYQFCGSTLADAQDQCWQPCPRGQSDCCLGLSCFDTSQDGGTCSSSDYSGTNHVSRSKY